ncbi:MULTISPECIES: Arc family DNA-binding protein [Acinetobacter calcoaceticus/baumannii complex]|uniref:Arc family DNA-binding protein n=1 Tax=Acinetobacter calcoaceticus/baumannii complex TaxID=909768 RepID=UPI0030169FE9
MSKNGGHLTVQYNLRWSEELRDKIADAAKDNTRSMNQEIIARLEQSFHFDEINAKGEIVTTEKSQEALTKSIHNTIAKLVKGLIAEGVNPEDILRASEELTTKE